MSREQDREITGEQVRREHLAEVKVPFHWAYLLGMFGGSFLIMMAFIAWLGAAS